MKLYKMRVINCGEDVIVPSQITREGFEMNMIRLSKDRISTICNFNNTEHYKEITYSFAINSWTIQLIEKEALDGYIVPQNERYFY